MAKISFKFTAPADPDFDRIGIVVHSDVTTAVALANSFNFTKVVIGLTPSIETSLDVFETIGGADLVRNVLYYVIINPGDSAANFRSDLTASDAVRMRAFAIDQPSSPSTAPGSPVALRSSPAIYSENGDRLLSNGTVRLGSGIQVLQDGTVILNSGVRISINDIVTLPVELQESAVVTNIPEPFRATSLEDIDLFELLVGLYYVNFSLKQSSQRIAQAIQKFLDQTEDSDQIAKIESARDRFNELLADRGSELVNYPTYGGIQVN